MTKKSHTVSIRLLRDGKQPADGVRTGVELATWDKLEGAQIALDLRDEPFDGGEAVSRIAHGLELASTVRLERVEQRVGFADIAGFDGGEDRTDTLGGLVARGRWLGFDGSVSVGGLPGALGQRRARAIGLSRTVHRRLAGALGGAFARARRCF